MKFPFLGRRLLRYCCIAVACPDKSTGRASHFRPNGSSVGRACAAESQWSNASSKVSSRKPGRKIFICLAALVFLICFSLSTRAQDTLTIDYLLDRIETQQVKRNNFFINGIFPSYINGNRKFKTRKRDNTIFYNALAGYILKDHYDKFSSEQKITCDSISQRSVRALSLFKNSKRPTYNFWRTDTSFTFPYNSLFGTGKTLPDDLDDTVLGLMMLNDNDSTTTAHTLMQLYVNSNPPLKTTYRIYSHDSAYSTWFGKKMPVVFDISVLCNILSFVQKEGLPWRKADSASLQLIVKTIERNDIVKHPLFVSPYYGNTAIILYHLSRLMSIKPIAELEQLKPQLVSLARERLQASKNTLEKIILSNSLLKWKVVTPALNLGIADVRDIETNDMPFFIGNIPSYFKQPWKEDFMGLRLMMYYHYCPARNDCLLLEYLILRSETVETLKH